MIASLIPTRVHGVIDYIVGIVLIAAPWLFNFADNRAAMSVPVVLGAGTILYSLVTDYEMGLAHILPMGAHLGIDMVAGLILIASPWLFGFADRIIWPHVVVGVMEVCVVLLSARVPAITRRDLTGGNIGRPGTV